MFFFQRYVHVVLDAVLGSYVKNIDPDALKISVWSGKIEVDAVELQPDAFKLPPEFRLVKGTLHQLRIELPWSNFANQPIRVDIQDMNLLLYVWDGDDTKEQPREATPEELEKQKKKLRDQLQRKRATIDAIEKATEINERNGKLHSQNHADDKHQPQNWTQSFFFKLLVKLLDNVQVQVQHLHLRLEDRVSDPQRPYAVGMTLESIIIKSADEGWNYTMVLRSSSTDTMSTSFLRKKMDVNKFGIYWSLPLVPVPETILDDGFAFAKCMQMHFWAANDDDTPPLVSTATFPTLFEKNDYLIHPITVSMRLTVNDGNAKLPLTHQELSNRVLARLGTPWMMETIDAIGDDAWQEFVDNMPKLAGDRKYTLGFVFSEAWAVARDLSEEEDVIPSITQFKEALASCLQWSRHEVDRLERCIVVYREAVVHVMEEKSTYIDADATIDQIRISLHRKQYLSALSLISFLTVRQRQRKYLSLRPKRIRVRENPAIWWNYAIRAVLMDVRERLARVDWQTLYRKKIQRKRYKELYTVLAFSHSFAASLVPEKVSKMSKDEAIAIMDELEMEMDVRELLRLRKDVRKNVTSKESEQKVIDAMAKKKIPSANIADGEPAGGAALIPPSTSSRLWGYAAWLTGTATNQVPGLAVAGRHEASDGKETDRANSIASDDVMWSEQDTKDLYDAIDFHPMTDSSENKPRHSPSDEEESGQDYKQLQEQQHIWYRFQLRLAKGSFGLSLKDTPNNTYEALPISQPSFGVSPSVGIRQRPSTLVVSLDEVDIQFLVRPKSMEMSLQLRDAFFHQTSDLSDDIGSIYRSKSLSIGNDFFLQRMDMDEVMRYHPADVQSQMSSVRLRNCERELPLIYLSIESRNPRKERDEDQNGLASADMSAAARLLRISLVTQALKCNVNLMFLLDVASVFTRPVNVDLSGLDQTAWQRARSLQSYSAAQLRDALARRTKVEMRLDVISPLINIVQSPSSLSQGSASTQVNMLMFLGHLRATTSHPSAGEDHNDNEEIERKTKSENSTTTWKKALTRPTDHLYDVLEFSISGIEAQIWDGNHNIRSPAMFYLPLTEREETSLWRYLLEKTSLSFNFCTSVTPDDPTKPLLKLFGGVDSIHLNMSASTFRSLVRLVRSFGQDFSLHAKRRADAKIASAAVSGQVNGISIPSFKQTHTSRLVKSSSYLQPGPTLPSFSSMRGPRTSVSERTIYIPFSNGMEEKKQAIENEIDDKDLMKLWTRVLCLVQFDVGEIVMKLQIHDVGDSSEKIVLARSGDIMTRLMIRSYDRRLEFALGTFSMEDILLKKASEDPLNHVVETRRFLMSSGTHETTDDSHAKTISNSKEQLIRVAVTNISSEAVLPKDKSMWKLISYEEMSMGFGHYSIWQYPLLTPFSVDASVRTLTINVHQDSLAELLVFFFERDKMSAEASSSVHADEVTESTSEPHIEESAPPLSPIDTEASGGTISKKFGAWMSSSFMENDTPLKSSPPIVNEELDEADTEDLKDAPASLQLRLHVDGLSLFLHLDAKQNPQGTSSAFMSLTTQKFCCCIHKFPRYLSIYSYLSSLKICDLSLSEKHLREIVSHGTINRGQNEENHDTTFGDLAYDDEGHIENSSILGHIPKTDEILNVLNSVPAVFACAAQFYGADQIQQAWHPGYSNRFSIRLKSPRIRFLYSFVNDFQQYFFNGILLQTVLAVFVKERPEMLWEGDFQLSGDHDGERSSQPADDQTKNRGYLGSDVVSMFPLIDLKLEDAVMEMPPHRMSSEALLLRFDRFCVSNEHVVDSFRSLENRIVAKVLLNSSLTQLQLDMSTLRIVSVILVDDEGENRGRVDSGFITQSLLGSTNFTLGVDFRSRNAMKFNMNFTPVHLVCNQEQYGFVLRVPYQNFRERSRYVFSQKRDVTSLHNSTAQSAGILQHRRSRSPSLVGGSASGVSKGHGDEESYGLNEGEIEERHALITLLIPEITMEILHGQEGYHPSSSGDLYMADKTKTAKGSLCVFDLSSVSSQADYNFSSGRFSVELELEYIHVRDSRINSQLSQSYRDVLVFERGRNEYSKAISISFARSQQAVDVDTVGFAASFLTSDQKHQARKRADTLSTPTGSQSRIQSQPGSLSTTAVGGLSDFGSSRHRRGSRTFSFTESREDRDRSVAGPENVTEETAGVIGSELNMDLVVDIVGFRVISSNIYYDMLKFLEIPWGNGGVDRDLRGDTNRSVPTDREMKFVHGDSSLEMNTREGRQKEIAPAFRKVKVEVSLGPSAVLLVEDPVKSRSRALTLSWEAKVELGLLQRLNPDEEGESEMKYQHQHQNQLYVRVGIDNIQATSRFSNDSIWAGEGDNSSTNAGADCLKPISLESVLHLNLQTKFLRFRTSFDRIMELRFGYLDFCTMVAALENILRRPVPMSSSQEFAPKRRSSSGSSISSLSMSNGGKDLPWLASRGNYSSSIGRHSLTSQASGNAIVSAEDQKRTPAFYGVSLIHLVSASFRGRLQTRPVVGFYSSSWKKRYLVLPFTSQERNVVQSVAFRILPAAGSKRKIGDKIYYGDRIILEATTGSTTGSDATSDASRSSGGSFAPVIISKYDQLGANGYLGPDGTAGPFETTIWKHGSTMFNSDKSVIYDREVIVLEELTIHRSLGKGKHFTTSSRQTVNFTPAKNGAQQLEGAHSVGTVGAAGGGYLMFNGVGDAPIPFALSIVSSTSLLSQQKEMVDSQNKQIDENGESNSSEEVKSPPPKSGFSSILQNLKVLEFVLPGINATVVNDFHNMLLPLLHFRVASLHVDVRGKFEGKFTALASLGVGIQAYNSQLAVWEPVIEDFHVNMAYHGKGGVLCDFCMSERNEVSPTGAVLRCDGMPYCLFRSSRTEIFAEAADHSWTSKHFIYRELLNQEDDDNAKNANTMLLVVKNDFNVNISRNIINVVLHFLALIRKVTKSDEGLSTRLGPYIYVDNQSGIPFAVATHPSASFVDPPPSNRTTPVSPSPMTQSVEVARPVPPSSPEKSLGETMRAETAAFNDRAWSSRRLSTMLNNISSSDTRWSKVESGERIATAIVAHEAPAGSVTSPLRRLLWLKPQSNSNVPSSSKPIPVPIGYSNRSYLHLESNNRRVDTWHGESIICETVAEQGTLVLRLRGKVQLTNHLAIPIQVMYNEEHEETIMPRGKTAHYIPIQFLERGTIAFRPLLTSGKLQRSEAFSIMSLLRSDSNAQRSRIRRQQIGSLELRQALTFYWDEHPVISANDLSSDFNVSLPPFQLILTAVRKSERHETTITLRPPVQLENLIPYDLSFRTICLKSEDEIKWISMNSASFSGSRGRISSGDSAYISELEVFSSDEDGVMVRQTPAIMGLSLAIPEIDLRRYSRWTKEALIYGCSSFCERIELSMLDESMPESKQNNEAAPVNKLTICVEVVQLQKLRLRHLNALAPVVCRVYTEYWLLDRTSLSLALYTADGYRIPSNSRQNMGLKEDQKLQDNSSASVSLSVYSSESKQHVSKMKIGIKGSKDKREIRSDAFDISAVGLRGQIFVPTKRKRESKSLLSTITEQQTDDSGELLPFKQYEFGVMIEQGPAKFSRSKVVTLVPRYYFVNSSNRFDIQIRQERCPSADAILVIPRRESKIFHWSDSRLPSRVQIRFVTPFIEGIEDPSSMIHSQWSSPFELSSVGNFVLRLKKNLRAAPSFLWNCFDGAPLEKKDDDEGSIFFDSEQFERDDEYSEELLAKGVQVHVAVELHDPSFFIYLEEGDAELGSKALTGGIRHDDGFNKQSEEFVPFKIKNECTNLELVVWQKTLVKDEKGQMAIGFEGGEHVPPFHTTGFVPYSFAIFPTLYVQVQKVSGLGKSKKDKRYRGKLDERKETTPIRTSPFVSSTQTHVLGTFEARLNKFQRLPTLDIIDGKLKHRLWVEVLLDETTKTLLVTDMLPGVSGEHKRRRRATLLRTWKRYNSSIVSISHTITDHANTGEETLKQENIAAKKKQVRFDLDGEKSGGAHRDDDIKESNNGNADGDPSAMTDDITAISVPDQSSSVAICVRLVEAISLENIFSKKGRVDLSACEPFLVFSLKSEGGDEVRAKLSAQPQTKFPRWLPAVDTNSVLSLLVREIDDVGTTHANVANTMINVEVREADLLFGSSLIGTVQVPLQEYCAALLTQSPHLQSFSNSLQVVEFLAPVKISGAKNESFFEDRDAAMIRFQMCCKYIPPGTSNMVNEWRDLTQAVAFYQMGKNLDVMLASRAELKLLLEREAVDTSTGIATPPGSQDSFTVTNEKKQSDLAARLAARSLDDSVSQTTESRRGSVTTDDSEGTYEELGDEMRLTAVLIGVSNLQIPEILVNNSYGKVSKNTPEPKIYCTITYKESTRSALSATAKLSVSASTSNESSGPSVERMQNVRTHEFTRGQPLGLDLIYKNGRVIVQGVVCDGPCGGLVYEGKIRIGDTVVAVNSKPIVNLHREASFTAIEKASRQDENTQSPDEKSTFTLSFLAQSLGQRSHPRSNGSTKKANGKELNLDGKEYDAEWNRRVEFIESTKDDERRQEAKCTDSSDDKVLIRVYLRNETSDHGLSASQESSVVPFLYFFGDDTMMDHLDHSKQDSRFDILLAECWVPLPPAAGTTSPTLTLDAGYLSETTFTERICALYSPVKKSQQHSALKMIGQLRLALKWDFVNLDNISKKRDDLQVYFQLEVARICVSIVDDGSASSAPSGSHHPQEVLCISMSDQKASAGIQLSYGLISDGKHVVNARIGHFQIDNQLLDTNYPVLLRPMRLVDAQQHDQQGYGTNGDESSAPLLLPTFQLMGVFSRQPNVIQFEYIFGQLQELELKLEDATLVALVHAFSGIHWSLIDSDRAGKLTLNGPTSEDGQTNLALQLLDKEWSTPMPVVSSTRFGRTGGNVKVLLRWLLLCPVKVNITFTSTTDRSLLLSLLSPDMSSVLSTLISAAAALVSNLDQAPIRIPEFYVENLLETTHTLGFYAMQHYLHHGLRSWYSIMGSVDFLGNPIGLVSTLGAGVKDFFYTPAQMLLEDEKGLRIENLRTGMTKGSKSLLRNTAVGIFHTTGKITETLGKGIAMLAMDDQYNVQRQRQSTKQIRRINDLGDAITEGSKGLVGGVWDGIKGVVAAPVRGAERDGAGGFVVGIGKGFAGLIVKPTAGFLDLLTSLSRGAKTSAEAIDGSPAAEFEMEVTRFRLPRRICSDGVLVSYSEREARGFAFLLLTSLDETDDYVYHVDYGMEHLRGLVLLTDKRVVCLSAKSGQKLWELALDSKLQVEVIGKTLKIGQSTTSYKTYNIECENEVSAMNFRIAIDSARVDLSATRYLLLNLEKNQEAARQGGDHNGDHGDAANEDERADLHVLMESVQDTMVTGVSEDDLQAQPLRSVRVELCHLENKDAHAHVPNRAIDKLLSFNVFQIQVYGGPYQWTVFRRFSEFRALYAALENMGYAMESLPSLPPRTFLPSTREIVAKSRQESLSVFLQASIMHSTISRSPVMLEFLTREAQEVRVSLPPLSPTGGDTSVNTSHHHHDASQRIAEDSS